MEMGVQVADNLIQQKKGVNKAVHNLPFPQAEAEGHRINDYDLAIIGGGLGGLALSILCARAGYHTVLFEKERYPFHRVCGEYISLESWNFLEDLGLPLSDMNLPLIKRLIVSAPNGKYIEQDLPLGGFGISRFKIDFELSLLAKHAGVEVMEETKITDVEFNGSGFRIESKHGNHSSTHCCAAFGKRSNLDVKWKRNFVQHKPGKLNNYVAVKYHVYFDLLPELICLHNFNDGYCGISRIEDNQCCLCYLTTAKNLQQNGNSIGELEKLILAKNPFLRKIFREAIFVSNEPVVISQVSFEKKSLIEDHILMVGDAAGMITPLCGNGMSMALHGAKLAFECIDSCLKGKVGRENMEDLYSKQWKSYFATRLKTGRVIQGFFGHPLLSNLLIGGLKPFPGISRWLIRQTHGEPF
ncbi:MAG TPA: NAD(P)-binding protein [Chitinophagaceae bacterium]|nr:NAD(P)-binding protein [Chitinophagaceae bacterium]